MKLRAIGTALAMLGGTLLASTAPQAQVFDDRQPGSALVYPLFDVNNDVGNARSTLLKISNLSNDTDVWVHFVRVCAGIKSFGGEGLCQASDQTAMLTPRETFVRDVANYFSIDRANCPTGYIVAYAQAAANDTTPIVFNNLIGSVHMNSAGPLNQRTAGLQAYGFQAVGTQGVQVPGSTGGAFPNLPFNNAGYAAPATTYQTDFLATSGSRASILTLLTLDIQASAQNTPTLVAIDAWNQDEEKTSAGLEYVCHVHVQLDDEINAKQPGAGVQGGLNFLEANFGSAYGHMNITPFTPGDAILGAITEVGQNRHTMRGLWHDDVARPTTFIAR